MSTRKIKDAKDLSTNELIYFKGHAQATYMSDGRTVEEAINSSGGSSSGSGSAITSIKIDNVSKSPSSGVVDLGYINKKVVSETNSSMTLLPNVYHINTNSTLSSLTIRLGNVQNSNIMNEYFVEFTVSKVGTTIGFPSDIKWVDNVTPTWEPGYTYQVSIVNNFGTYNKFNSSAYTS